MSLSAGTRLGSYEIACALGAGGMGEVYRARDTKLGRDVAIKVLPEPFANDPERLARFEREARVLASLNHPHIAQIYGVLELPRSPATAGAGVALVMELANGDDLRRRLARGALPIDEALHIAKQIAEALEAAHEQGIVHRDLKPANVTIKDDGTVKVLDFGLAKAFAKDPVSATAEAADSPTFTMRGTQLGVILGTAAYMAPEQAKGKPVDRRADVWAFGVVLHEMLTGQQLFGRDDVSDTLAAVLTSEPNLAALPPGTPTAIRRLVARCLVKDKQGRLDSMIAARLEIEDALRAPEVPGETRRPAALRFALVAALVVAAVAVGSVAQRLWSSPPGSSSATTAVVAQISAAPGTISAFHHGFAVSPDGRSLAFAARDANGTGQIWLRHLDDPVARPIQGTANGARPFWSPDGTRIAFFAEGRLRRVPASGGPAQTICPVSGTFATGSWSGREDILFGVRQRNEWMIFKVPAAGGVPAALGVRGRNPQWLDDGRRFLFAGLGKAGIGVDLGSTDGDPPRRIVDLEGGDVDDLAFVYSLPGTLFVNRQGALAVQRIDPRTMARLGSATAIAGRAGTPGGWLAVSAAGDSLAALVARGPNEIGDPGDPVARLLWVNRQGEALGELGEPGRFYTLHLSPDGHRAAANPDDNIWIVGPARRRLRVTGAYGFHAVWSPDGSEIVYRTWTGPLMRTAVDRETPPIAVAKSAGRNVTDWSRDRRSLLLDALATSDAGSDILVYDLSTETERTWLATEFNESQARFSPDGARVAYVSNASGQFEVYVRAFVGTETALQVSAGGGLHPIWRRDGRELFYLGPNDEMMVVEMSPPRDRLQPGRPRQLFRIPLNDVTRQGYSPYDISPDGQRFLLNVPESPTPLFYVRGVERFLSGLLPPAPR